MNTEKQQSPFATQMSETIKNQLLETQDECTFIWSTRQGDGTGASMSYLWAKNHLWLTTRDNSPRIAAIRRNPAVSVVISGAGTTLGKSRGITIRGKALLHEAQAEHTSWFFKAYTKHLLPHSPTGAKQLEQMLKRPNQIIIEVIPEKWICYDGQNLMKHLADMA